MSETLAPLIAGDFIAAGADTLLQFHCDVTCHALHDVLWKAAESARAAGQERSAYALRLLAAIYSMRLVLGDKKIYRAMIEWDDSNLDIEPDKLSEVHHDAQPRSPFQYLTQSCEDASLISSELVAKQHFERHDFFWCKVVVFNHHLLVTCCRLARQHAGSSNHGQDHG